LTDNRSQHVSLNPNLQRAISDFSPKHAFPHDFRSGPSLIDWDPSKWVISALYKLGFVTSLRRARNGDLKEAIEYMHRKEILGVVEVETDTWNGKVWNARQVQEYVGKLGKCVVMIDGFVVDVTSYLGDHVSKVTFD
jgi:stearoyl-CoA desaturase (Delta-9 desaturase)